ncbi:MAG: hypothetical protein HOM14_20590 [Gammaproteobacteria bacterium]|jgi:Spy/CpxP family protein refolding chaperone|nr:hypothetical protein [Gammaproteobacteria bacterium]MBT3725061.1 hypothetical protein [Gammaproteobacteria bacterium]MBT4078040.1 hypothetical protein [Gammaproteobacteria bacterium]MBT4195091.1 hypothetical protein [Gammaproteobacteria bacterium]MBT4451340.1 hypothetical protein [Gammaproteobacteria bacterium]
MKKSSKIIIVSVLTLGLAGGAFAFGSHHYFSSMSMHEKAEMFEGHVSKRLDLNDVQQDKLGQLTDRITTIMQQVKQERQDHEQFLQQLITDQPLDQTELLSKINQKTAMINDNAPEMVGLLASFVDSLDAEQKAKIKGMIEKRKGHRFGRHARWSE